MPWFLNPRVYELLPLHLNPELYYVVLKLLATGLFARGLVRQGVRGRALASATWSFFFGLFVAVMLSLHALVVLGLRVFERAPGAPFVYDFRLFSLLLLAGVLVPQGVRCLRAAPGLARGEGAAWRDALRATCVVAAVGLALVPLQFFGLVLTAMGAVSLALLLVARPAAPRLRVEPPTLDPAEFPGLRGRASVA
ncbi:MAG TPA: hypothetical protein VHG51_20255 [Longimicrobiaceae bacterium]|nr:hypothetical protein [Longimicrobiaceae bacterium]